MLGKTSMEELMGALDLIVDVLAFIADKKDSDDKDEKSAARAALAAICLHELMTHGVIAQLAKEMGDKIAAEAIPAKVSTPKSISIPIPIPNGEKS